MPNYIVKNDQIHFRQSFPRDILATLFVTLYALGVNIEDSGNKIFPHRITISESEFLSVIQMTKE